MKRRELTINAEQMAKHGEVITAYLNGATIQVFDSLNNKWKICAIEPDFIVTNSYRVSPWTPEKIAAHGEVIHAWERGEDVEFKGAPTATWRDLMPKKDREGYPAFGVDFEYRVKAKEIFTCGCGKHTLVVSNLGYCYHNGTRAAIDGEFVTGEGTVVKVDEFGKVAGLEVRYRHEMEHKDSLTFGFNEDEYTAHISKLGRALFGVDFDKAAEKNVKDAWIVVTPAGKTFAVIADILEKDMDALKEEFVKKCAEAPEDALDHIFSTLAGIYSKTLKGGKIRIQPIDAVVETPADAEKLYEEITGKAARIPAVRMQEKKPFYEERVEFYRPYKVKEIAALGSRMIFREKDDTSVVRRVSGLYIDGVAISIGKGNKVAVSFENLYKRYLNFDGSPAGVKMSTTFKHLKREKQLDMLRAETTKLTKRGYSMHVKELLDNFHTKRLTNLNPAYYLRYAEELHKLLLKYNLC